MKMKAMLSLILLACMVGCAVAEESLLTTTKPAISNTGTQVAIMAVAGDIEPVPLITISLDGAVLMSCAGTTPGLLSCSFTVTWLLVTGKGHSIVSTATYKSGRSQSVTLTYLQ
jgi:hypothetical protein